MNIWETHDKQGLGQDLVETNKNGCKANQVVTGCEVFHALPGCSCLDFELICSFPSPTEGAVVSLFKYTGPGA